MRKTARLYQGRRLVVFPRKYTLLRELQFGCALIIGQGISLSIDQYAALLKAIPSINAALRERGHEFNEPDSSIADEPVVSKKAKKEKPSKANIEATSEEDN